jgi:hypothetical protein
VSATATAAAAAAAGGGLCLLMLMLLLLLLDDSQSVSFSPSSCKRAAAASGKTRQPFWPHQLGVAHGVGRQGRPSFQGQCAGPAPKRAPASSNARGGGGRLEASRGRRYRP